MAMQNRRMLQMDMFKTTEDALLAERLMQTEVAHEIQGMYRSSDQYVNSLAVAHVLIEAVGVRNVVEFCVTELERRSGD